MKGRLEFLFSEKMKKIFHNIKINKYTIIYKSYLTKKTKMENCHFCMPIIYFATALTFLHEVLRDRNSNFFVTKNIQVYRTILPPSKNKQSRRHLCHACILLFMGNFFFGKSWNSLIWYTILHKAIEYHLDGWIYVYSSWSGRR